jgi:DNA-binding CsgD family transcriptional regulator/tetratricopeptide (TPR) repeat protein
MDTFLERGVFLQELSVRLEQACACSGSLTFIGGEAGVGKTTLARKFCELAQRTCRIAWGICDPVSTPAALGPVVELIHVLDADVATLLEDPGRRRQGFRAALDLLHSVMRPAVLVIEDVHWADEATLDFLRFIARRVDDTAAVLVATYRDDEVGLRHVLRGLLGDLATSRGVHRIALPPLSASGVRALAEGSGLDAALLHQRTGGNPFFVAEILASGSAEIPATVLDMILTRASRLSPPARSLLDACAVIGVRIEPWLLERVSAPAAEVIGECLSQGMLSETGATLAFRHELTREAILRALPAQRASELHRAVLRALRPSALAGGDPARLAHHADAAGDEEAVLEYAREAAQRAAALGAHREAAAQYGRALRAAKRLPPAMRAELLEHRSYECHLTEQHDEAIMALECALRCYKAAGDLRKEGNALRWLSRLLWFAGPIARANEVGQQAVTLLERLPPGRELALAHANMAHLRLNTEDSEGTATWARRALELAERLGDVEIRTYALSTLGCIEFRRGDPSTLERSLRLAQEAGLEDHVGRAFASLAMTAVDTRSHELAARYIDEAMGYMAGRDVDAWRLRLLAIRAYLALDEGRWTEAVDATLAILRQSRTSFFRGLPLMTLGLARARRGDPDVWPVLDELLSLEAARGELQGLWPVAAARAEAAWIEGRPQVVKGETEAAFRLAVRAGEPWPIGELAYWRWRAGIREAIPPDIPPPYAAQIAGQWQRAADLWTRIGCPYQTALALAESDDLGALRRALETWARRGARPPRAVAAPDRAKLGVRDIPRRPRRSTHSNPRGLTAREHEILLLLAEGSSNTVIADRLYVSAKTVEHHVSAILSKLGVRTRGEAVREAVRSGLVRFTSERHE